MANNTDIYIIKTVYNGNAVAYNPGDLSVTFSATIATNPSKYLTSTVSVTPVADLNTFNLNIIAAIKANIQNILGITYVSTDIISVHGLTPLINKGTAILDFSSTPSDEASVDVTGQTFILATSQCQAWFSGVVYGSSDEIDHLQAAQKIALVCGVPTAGVGFTIYADCLHGLYAGQLQVNWRWI